MNRTLVLLVIVAVLVSLLIGCANSQEKQLRELGYRLSSQEFLRSVQNGDSDSVSLFLATKMSPDTRDELGLTALMIAVDAGHVDVVKTLISGKADINATSTKDGFTALHLAASQADLETCRLLLDAGASLGLGSNDGTTPLMVAVKGSYDVVSLLLERGAPINSQNKLGETALMMTARNERNGYYEIAQLLIDNGADLNLESLQGQTALEYSPPESAVRELLWNLGARGSALARQYQALRDAVQAGDVEKARMYIHQGLDPDIKGTLSLAVRNTDREMIFMLLDEGACIDGHASIDTTPLMTAIDHELIEMAELLLEKGVDINRTTEWGAAIHVAAMHNRVSMAEFLMSRGANIESKDPYGHTPLMIAAQYGCLDAVRFLISAGANVNARTVWNTSLKGPHEVSPLTIAESYGHKEVAEILRAAGAK